MSLNLIIETLQSKGSQGNKKIITVIKPFLKMIIKFFQRFLHQSIMIHLIIWNLRIMSFQQYLIKLKKCSFYFNSYLLISMVASITFIRKQGFQEYKAIIKIKVQIQATILQMVSSDCIISISKVEIFKMKEMK